MTDIDRAVWLTVKRGDRKGTALSPGVVFARTGIRPTGQELTEATERLLADGRLFWRSPRVRRRVLAGPWPDEAVAAEPSPSLFDNDTEINETEEP